jgi:membrane protein implicated in regulation of membrane protease activity
VLSLENLAWLWLTGGILVAALEILAPGVYLLWAGLAAVVVGLVVMAAPGLSLSTQLLFFAGVLVASAFAGQLVYRRLRQAGDEPSLNRRGEQLVGRQAVLEEPIVSGVGRVRLGDTTWRVQGPDLPSGTAVRISAADGGVLTVAPVVK